MKGAQIKENSLTSFCFSPLLHIYLLSIGEDLIAED